MTWRRADGQLLDPWMRLHARLGARVATPLPRSMRITGTVEEWERWIDLAPSGVRQLCVCPRPRPLTVDREANLGRYWEPNVWMATPSSPDAPAARLTRCAIARPPCDRPRSTLL